MPDPIARGTLSVESGKVQLQRAGHVGSSSSPPISAGPSADHLAAQTLRKDVPMSTRVTLPADVHQIDATGFVWTFLDEADDPVRVAVGGSSSPVTARTRSWPASSTSSKATRDAGSCTSRSSGFPTGHRRAAPCQPSAYLTADQRRGRGVRVLHETVRMLVPARECGSPVRTATTVATSARVA